MDPDAEGIQDDYNHTEDTELLKKKMFAENKNACNVCRTVPTE